MSAGMKLRERHFLIGDVEPQICGNKLPSIGQVLKLLLYTMENINKNKAVRISARSVFNEVKVFWNKARLPIRHESRCLDKIVKLHTDYRALKKQRGRSSNLAKEVVFAAQLNNLFDISHGNIIRDLANDDPRKDFYLSQKQDGRVGHISDVESIDISEKDENKKKEMLGNLVPQNEIKANKLDNSDDSASSSEGTSEVGGKKSTTDSGKEQEYGPSIAKRPRTTTNVLDDGVVAALDKRKTSNGTAAHTVSPVAEPSKIDVPTLALNASSIQRVRRKVRQS